MNKKCLPIIKIDEYTYDQNILDPFYQVTKVLEYKCALKVNI